MHWKMNEPGQAVAFINPKISLLWTCLVTNIRRDGTKVNVDRVDYLERTLESLKAIDFHSANVYLQLGPDLGKGLSDFSASLGELASTVTVHNFRLENVTVWQEAIERVKDEGADLVLLLTYEDHFFHESAIHEFKRLASSLIQLSEDCKPLELFAVLSHFPELHIQTDFWEALGRTKKVGESVVFPSATPIGCLLVHPETLARWFQIDFAGGGKVVSTENYFGRSVEDGFGISIAPRRELFEHFDGYDHVGISNRGLAISAEHRRAGISLLGKSFTYQALRRCGLRPSKIEYVRLAINLRGFSNGTRLVLRSAWNWLVGNSVGRILGSQALFWSWILHRPRLTHILSVASSHGFFRFAILEIKSLSNSLKRAKRT
jgi:hypothetical protein